LIILDDIYDAAVVSAQWPMKGSCTPECRGSSRERTCSGYRIVRSPAIVLASIVKQFYTDRPFTLWPMHFRVYRMKLTCLHWTQSSVGQVRSPKRPLLTYPSESNIWAGKGGTSVRTLLSSKITIK
jgi:hypothetical protein